MEEEDEPIDENDDSECEPFDGEPIETTVTIVTILPPPPPTQEEKEDAETAAEMILSDAARFERWQSKRPIICHLPSGVVEGKGMRLPLFDIGARIVVEHRASCLDGNPWLETLVGRVRSIDDDTGVVTFFVEESGEGSTSVRYTSFKDPIYDIRLAPKKGNPFTVERVRVSPLPVPGTSKKCPGRPAGTKNRPKEVIKAEREALQKLREEKKARRKACKSK